jgi:hypothetical protein
MFEVALPLAIEATIIAIAGPPKFFHDFSLYDLKHLNDAQKCTMKR